MVYQLNEKQSATYKASLIDESGAAVPGSSLSTLTLTLYDRATGTIINGRNNQNVKNANDVTVDEQGNLVWEMRPEDNVIITDRASSTATYVDGELVRGIEDHCALFRATWRGGTRAVSHQITINVVNLGQLT